MSKNVIGYIRVSTDAQASDDRYGLEAQREDIIKYCKANDLNIVKWYSDEGESGAKYRPGFDEIVYGDINNPPYEAVVVAKSDRVARDINIYFYYQGALLRKGIELISICEDFGQFGVFANMLKAFTLTCAEMERDNINKRTKAGRAVKSSKGGYSGGRPAYGYASVGGKLVVVPEEAEVVREVFNYKNAGLTYRDIAKIFKDKGYKTRRDKDFAASTIQVIYNNKKLYLGYYKYGGDKWVLGVHDSIL